MSVPTTTQHTIEWSRPAEAIPLQEQLDAGGQTNFVQYRPGPWAEVRCSCGFAASGPAQDVIDGLNRHRAEVAQ